MLHLKHETGNYHHYDHHDSFRLMAQALSSFFRPVCVFFYQHALPPETGAENDIKKKEKKEREKHERFARQDLLSSQRGFTPGAKVHLWASRLLLVFTWENHPISLVGGCSRGWKMNCQTPEPHSRHGWVPGWTT